MADVAEVIENDILRRSELIIGGLYITDAVLDRKKVMLHRIADAVNAIAAMEAEADGNDTVANMRKAMVAVSGTQQGFYFDAEYHARVYLLAQIIGPWLRGLLDKCPECTEAFMRFIEAMAVHDPKHF